MVKGCLCHYLVSRDWPSPRAADSKKPETSMLATAAQPAQTMRGFVVPSALASIIMTPMICLLVHARPHTTRSLMANKNSDGYPTPAWHLRVRSRLIRRFRSVLALLEGLVWGRAVALQFPVCRCKSPLLIFGAQDAHLVTFLLCKATGRLDEVRSKGPAGPSRFARAPVTGPLATS